MDCLQRSISSLTQLLREFASNSATSALPFLRSADVQPAPRPLPLTFTIRSSLRVFRSLCPTANINPTPFPHSRKSPHVCFLVSQKFQANLIPIQPAPSQFSGHSFRIRAATSAAAQGLSSASLQQFSRCSSS
ncbi:hypothetical protein AMECASPLE_022513, partial [Ameca splendens]